jgi:hypothetical protein
MFWENDQNFHPGPTYKASLYRVEISCTKSIFSIYFLDVYGNYISG